MSEIITKPNGSKNEDWIKPVILVVCEEKLSFDINSLLAIVSIKWSVEILFWLLTSYFICLKTLSRFIYFLSKVELLNNLIYSYNI